MVRLAGAGLALLIGLAVAAGPAQAQAVPPIEESVTQGAQIEEAVRRAERPGDPEAVDDQAIDGEAGVYVLKKEKIFYLAASAGLGYSTNPLRTADDVGGSGSADASLSAGLRTRLGGAVDFGLAANVEGTRYFEAFAPSNNVASGNISLGAAIPKTPIYVGAAGFGGWNFDEDFKAPVSFYGASAHVSASLKMAPNVVVQPAIVATRLWTEVKENDTKTVSGRLSITAFSGPMAVTLTGSASRIWFDNFYEDVTFVARDDWQYDVAASLSYRILPSLTLNANVRYTKRDSPFFLADYRSLENGLSLGAVLRF